MLRELRDKLSPLYFNINLSCKCVCVSQSGCVHQNKIWVLGLTFYLISLMFTDTHIRLAAHECLVILNCTVGEPALQMYTALHPTFLASEDSNPGPYDFRTSTLSTQPSPLPRKIFKRYKWQTTTRHHWALLHTEDSTGQQRPVSQSPFKKPFELLNSHSPPRKRPRLNSAYGCNFPTPLLDLSIVAFESHQPYTEWSVLLMVLHLLLSKAQ